MEYCHDHMRCGEKSCPMYTRTPKEVCWEAKETRCESFNPAIRIFTDKHPWASKKVICELAGCTYFRYAINLGKVDSYKEYSSNELIVQLSSSFTRNKAAKLNRLKNLLGR